MDKKVIFSHQVIPSKVAHICNVVVSKLATTQPKYAG